MNVEIWSDVVCPWCYIGKRHFEAALTDFGHRDDVRVVWRSFQLDPSAPVSSDVDSAERLAAKYGMSREQAVAAQARVTAVAAEAGLTYHLDRARSTNTFTAHRLLHFAASVGAQDALEERLFAAHFTEGQHLGDTDVLVRLAGEVGMDEGAVRAVIDGDDFADAVRDDVDTARRLGISGVPFFVIDRHYGISGAQPTSVILETLNEVWAETHATETSAPR